MLFSSLTFVWFFLPALALIYYISPGRKLKNGVLLIASLVFYSWGEPRYVVLVILSILLNYGFGLALDGCGERRGLKKAVFVLSILADLGLLGYFKYFNFFLELAMSLLGRQGFTPRDIALPIGISFYTFQSISYLADTFRGENPAQRNVFRLALYISLFPQILSGPIVKYHELKPQIGDRQESLSMHAYGIKRFVYGLVKKMVFANMFGQVVDRMFDLPLEQLGTAAVWLAVILYSFQIYYDFSGYSDMAIGLGRMFNFRFLENFDHPYGSRSIQEFWRRWHISLSTWFRDYLYIPLGGSRKGPVRTYVNLFVVFLLCGVWHGAAWNFVAWGVYHGIGLVAERCGFRKVVDRMPKALGNAYVLLFVIVGWVLFRAPDMGYAWSYICNMFGGATAAFTSFNASIDFLSLDKLLLLLIGCVVAYPVFDAVAKHTPEAVRLVCGMSFFVVVYVLAMTSAYSPFIYFRF